MLQLGAGAMRQTECARLLFQLVTHELWLLWDTLNTINPPKTRKTLSICAFNLFFLLWVIIYLIFYQSTKEKTILMDLPEQAIVHHSSPCRVKMHVKHITWCQMAQTHHSSPALAKEPYKQWMNEKYDDLCDSYLVCSAETISSSSLLHTRWSLIKKTSDSYQHLCVPALFDFAGEDTDLILGHNLQCILVNVPVVVGQNKIFTTHSGTWQGLEAFPVGSLPE